jgi:hypothetical protein
VTTGESNGNRSLLEAIQFTHYIDPSGRFELDYPSDWTLYEEDDNQDDVDVAWNTVNSSSTPTSLVFTIALPPEPVPNGYTLEQVIALFREAQISMFPNVTSSVSQPSLTNYTISGQPAASFEVKQNATDEQMGGFPLPLITEPHKLFVVSIFNSKGFILEFTMNQADYPTLLPVIDRIIESIRITGL